MLETNPDHSSSRLRYDLDSFVVVKGKKDREELQIWIGRVIDRIMKPTGCVKHLRIHWYEAYGDEDVTRSKYRPLFVKNKSTNRKDIPWVDNVSCETILNNFPSLTSQRKLPILVANDIRERVKISRSGN